MQRRQFVQAMAAPLVAPAPRPNLLFLFSDEHRACSMPGEPDNDARAPNLERLSREGTVFRNCVSNYPVCSPYRAMLLSGRWPYQTGVIDNEIALDPKERSLGAVFRGAGYRTGYIGKWHLQDRRDEGRFVPEGPARHGFDEWHVWYGTDRHFDYSYTFDPATGSRIQPKGYNATLMTGTALDFVARNRERPWMLTVSWNPPHPLFADAPAAQMRLYDPPNLRVRPNAEPRPAQLAGYNAHITAVDAEVGRLLERLRETGQDGRTIVVYTSDHGEMMGSHGQTGKRLPYEESCKVPFLVRYPGVVPAGGRRDELLGAIDLYPSVCALAGLPVPRHCSGRDLSPFMRGEAARAPESAFLMHIRKTNSTGGEDNPAPLFRGLRTARYTYAVREDGPWCLFDNREDPYQIHNLVRDPGRSGLARDLAGELRSWLRKAEDPFATATS